MASYNFLCYSCGIIIMYDMILNKYKRSEYIICKCPNCKNMIKYGNLLIQKQKKKESKNA